MSIQAILPPLPFSFDRCFSAKSGNGQFVFDPENPRVRFCRILKMSSRFEDRFQARKKVDPQNERMDREFAGTTCLCPKEATYSSCMTALNRSSRWVWRLRELKRRVCLSQAPRDGFFNLGLPGENMVRDGKRMFLQIV